MEKKILTYLVCLIVFSSNIPAYAAEDALYEEMMFFSNVLNHIRANYVEEVEPSKLIGSAVYGVLTSLDPHTIYLNSYQYKKLMEISEGKAFGVGIEFAIINGLPTVISVIRGGPAENSAIQTGDILIKVDDKYVTDITEPELKLSLSGEKGSKVKLTFKKSTGEEEFIIQIKRGEFPIHSVDYYFINTSSTGYIKIDQFSKTTGKEVTVALKDLAKKGMKSLVLDLRDNPGGTLESAVEVIDLFIPKDEIIVEVKARKEISNKTYSATDSKKQPLYPIIVMINRGSASASELVAGALQDYDRALIVGESSFGKGLVQRIFLLDDGGVMLMTIARYYTPSGRIIQRDYKGKSLREYFTEINTTDTSNPDSSLIFTTKGGRKVLGKGGITPDVIAKADSIPFPNPRELENSIFKYGVEFAANKKGTLASYKNFEDYEKNFHVNETIQKEFISKSKEDGLDVEKIEKETQSINNLIKSEIAGIHWGKREKMISSLKNDSQFNNALGNLPEATKILELYNKNFKN